MAYSLLLFQYDTCDDVSTLYATSVENVSKGFRPDQAKDVQKFSSRGSPPKLIPWARPLRKFYSRVDIEPY
jgi:hypothetical protein